MKLKKLVAQHFTEVGVLPNQKMMTWQCNYCKKKCKHHTTRMAEHLVNICVQTPGNVSANVKSQMKKKQGAGNKKRRRSSSSQSSGGSTEPDSVSVCSTVSAGSSRSSNVSESLTGSKRSQTIINYCDKITAHDQKYGAYLFALSVYSSGLPLCLTEDRLWQMLFTFIRPKFQLPNRRALSTNMLEDTYIAIKSEVDHLINTADSLCLQCDGWSNVRGEGIINFVVTTPGKVKSRKPAKSRDLCNISSCPKEAAADNTNCATGCCVLGRIETSPWRTQTCYRMDH